MIELKGYVPSSKKKVSNITVIGVGGGGSNAVENMYNQGITNVEFIICNTDVQALNSKKVPLKIMIGPNTTKGLGTGADPKLAQEAALESSEEIKRALMDKNTKMIFITAGMGGGTGTGAAPVIARIAREMDILSVGIVTMPLKAEGKDRMNRAKEGLLKLKDQLDAILIIDNAMVLKIFGDLTWEEAFNKADEILSIGAKSLAEILIKDDFHINTDFNDVCKTMRNTGVFLMGTSKAKSNSENIVDELVDTTLQSPLLMQNDISGAKNILLAISNGTGGVKASKIDAILERIQDIADGEAEIITGLGVDDTLEPDEVKMTIIATGFDSTKVFSTYGLNSANKTSNLSGAVDALTSKNESEDISNAVMQEVVSDVIDELELLKEFETIPAFTRLNRDIYHHIDPSRRKIVKLSSIDM